MISPRVHRFVERDGLSMTCNIRLRTISWVIWIRAVSGTQRFKQNPVIFIYFMLDTKNDAALEGHTLSGQTAVASPDQERFRIDNRMVHFTGHCPTGNLFETSDQSSVTCLMRNKVILKMPAPDGQPRTRMMDGWITSLLTYCLTNYH